MKRPCGVRLDARLMNFQRRGLAMSEPTMHEVSNELATLREQMNTHQAKYEGALDRFRADMAQKDTALERFRADMESFRADMGSFRADMSKNDTALERLRTDMAQSEISRMRWLVGIWVAGVLVTIAALGIFIRLAI